MMSHKDDCDSNHRFVNVSKVVIGENSTAKAPYRGEKGNLTHFDQFLDIFPLISTYILRDCRITHIGVSPFLEFQNIARCSTFPTLFFRVKL